MTSNLLPCPFCNSSAMPGVKWAQCSNSACPAFHIHTTNLEAWNRRATQPAASEPIAWRQIGQKVRLEWFETKGGWMDGAPPRFLVEGVRDGWCRLQLAYAAPPALGEPVYQWHDETAWQECNSKREYLHAKENGIRVRILWTAPPAAAYGDEAVRFESPEALAKALFDHGSIVTSRLVADRIFAAMRAQGDGEVQ